MKLKQLQRWMQAVVVHPGETEAALRAPEAARLVRPDRIETVLLPSPTLTPAQRLAVYQEMYPLRMRDALASDYPGLEHFLGDRFINFVAAYTKRHPSMRYTLNRLGDHVPKFIARQKTFKPRSFLADLARLEFALTEAFDEAERSPLSTKDFEKISAERLPKIRLGTVPSMRLVRLEWNAGEYLDSLKDEGHRHPKPRKAKSNVVVFRRAYRVYRMVVSNSAFALLADLEKEMSLGDAVARALRRTGMLRPKPDDFGQWFKEWTSEGLLSLDKG